MLLFLGWCSTTHNASYITHSYHNVEENTSAIWMNGLKRCFLLQSLARGVALVNFILQEKRISMVMAFL